MARKRGVFFLANDNILDLVIAFLNSFRSYNPSVPLCLIPYNDDARRVMQLQSQYGFSIWQDSAVLQRCDDISLSFHDHILGYYRKLATWQGEFDEFIYIDSDTVVLENIDFVFHYLKEFSFLTSTSNMPQTRKFVWKESIGETGKLTEEQFCFAANMGFIASRKGCLDLSDVVSRLPAAMELADHMELSCGDQPFLNYLIVTSGMRYTSLHTIAHVNGLWDLPRERWAGEPDLADIVVRDGRFVSPEIPPPLLVHWAGLRLPLFELWNFYRGMKMDG